MKYAVWLVRLWYAAWMIPAGLEHFFLELGVPVATRTTAPAKFDQEQQRAFIEKAKALAPKYRTELLKEA